MRHQQILTKFASGQKKETSSPDGEGQVNKTVGLGIAYTPALLPDNTSLLLINGLTNDLKWQGSTLAETIVIKQVDIPKN